MPGMLVFTLDPDGNKVVMPIELVSKVLVSRDHRMCHLILNDGRQLFVSPGHPTADNGRVGDLEPGDVLDGAGVVSIEKVRYEAGHTYDLLPSGGTGCYWADGVLLGSTLSANSRFFIRKPVRPEDQPYYG
jgi:hypothetical protein